MSRWMQIAARLWVCFACLMSASSAAYAADESGLAFSDVVGWWSAEPTFAGESSRVLLHFQEEEGKHTARLSLLAIGGYEVPIGTVTIEGHTLSTQPHAFPLTYDAHEDTLKGYLPEAAVPVYRIPVEFRRIDPFPKPTLPTWEHPRPTIKWRVQLQGPVWAGLARDPYTKVLFVGTDEGMLHAIDDGGGTRWSFATGAPIKARPAVIGDAVYVASDSGYLYKLNKRNGKEHWRAKIDAGSPDRIPTTQPSTRWDRYASSVVADTQQVYFASRDKHLYALDIESGEQRWRVATQDLMTATPALHDERVVFASYDGKIQAVSSKDGESLWSYDARLPISGDLAVDGDRIFAGSRTYDLIALDATNGRELWKRYYWFSWIESPPVVKEGIVYTGSSDATNVYAIDASVGNVRWKTAVPGWAWARTAVDDRLVVAATVGQGAYPGVRAGSLLALDRDSGEIRWMFLEPPSAATVEQKLEWGFAASPLVAEDTVYAADLDGTLYALEAPALDD